MEMEDDERPIYLLTVRAEPGVDAIRALRAWLKIGLRTFGLKCVGITPREEETAMDLRDYAPKYIKADQVRDGPIQARVLNVFESERYGRPVLELDNGSQFMVNETNLGILIKAWGYQSEDFIGQELELSLGTYKDWREDPPAEKETVKVHTISPPKTGTGNSGAPSKSVLPASKTFTAQKDDFSDEVPF
jgi:hypothetical protein